MWTFEDLLIALLCAAPFIFAFGWWLGGVTREEEE